ncbi:hypothetical protein ACIBH1_46070 [Nonomuraea sp. NPDC050663]|uniref:hypothetical protein n=1 Tax=Nonomuraea sp. NPDC050663 TaxID=3364370 RepID=UPI0037B61DEE
MKLRSVSALAAGVLMALTGLVVTAPAASAASVSGCDSSRVTEHYLGWVKARVVMSRGCDVKSGSNTYRNQDFVSFSLKDTKCDKSGVRITIHRGDLALWTKYNGSGCDETVTGTGWTGAQSGKWYVNFSGDKYGQTPKVTIS